MPQRLPDIHLEDGQTVYVYGKAPVRVFYDKKVNPTRARVLAAGTYVEPPPPGPVTVTAVFTADAAIATPVVPPPVTGTLYGPGIGADTQRNHRTGEFNPVTYTFIAEKTGTITGFRYYMEAQGNYGSGDGGSRVITLSDKNGNVLMNGSHTGRPASGSNDRFQTVSGSAAVTKGEKYTIKWVNSGGGDVSINAHFEWHSHDPDQLRYPDWGVYRAGVLQEQDIPILQLFWSDGTWSGNGYYGTSQVSPNQSPIGGSNQVRERFTPKADVTFTEIWVRLKRDSSSVSGNLVLKLGPVTGTIAASAFPVGSQTDSSGNDNGWAKATVPATTLKAGTEYSLVLTAASGLHAQTLGKNAWGFKDPFPDGKAEKSSNGGSSWGPCGWYDSTNANQDIQFGLK